MSLRKLFTNKPGNVEEFIEMNGENPIDILYHVWEEAGPGGDDLIRGRIIYSSGSKEELIARDNLRLIQDHNVAFSGRRFYTPEEMVEELKEESDSARKAISSRGLTYKEYSLIKMLE